MHEKNSYIYPVSRQSLMAKNQSNFTVRNCGMTNSKMVFQLIKMSLINVSINHIQNNFSRWSYGVVLWEMYSCGLVPYSGMKSHELVEYLNER